MTYRVVLGGWMGRGEQFGCCAWRRMEESQEFCVKRKMLDLMDAAGDSTDLAAGLSVELGSAHCA